jgi:hypothetical protein
MRRLLPLFVLAFAGVVQAQTWEIGGAGGAGFAGGLSVSGPAGQAGAGLTHSPAAGGHLSQVLNRRWTGEIRYTFRLSDLALSTGGARTTFGGNSHAVHYDMLYHTRDDGSPVRPFLAGGAGIRLYRGTGEEAAYQPLQEFALLTKTQEWKPLLNFGAGVKYRLSGPLVLRIEARYYVTPFPTKVITPALGATHSGWVHEVVPLVGISYLLE